MKDIKRAFGNFVFDCQQYFDTLMQTLLRVLATFLIWFAMSFGAMFALFVVMKLFKMYF